MEDAWWSRPPPETATVDVPPGGMTLKPSGGELAVHLARYSASEFPVDLGAIAGVSRLRIPPDGSDQQWRAQILGSTRTRICALR